MIRRLALSIFLSLPLCCFAALTARVDRQEVSLNEAFTLTLVSDKRVHSEPDFTELSNYFIIVGQSKSAQFTLMNGKSQSIITWTISLVPKKNGTLIIPPIMIGKEKSNPVRVTVKKPAAGEEVADQQDIFMQAKAMPHSIFVNSQIAYSVKLYYDVNLTAATLSPPQVADAAVEPLGDDLHYAARVHGKTYQVTERRYAIIPKKPGKLTIKPPVLVGQIPFVDQRTDPFIAINSKPVRVSTEKLVLSVRKKPADIPVGRWFPARKVSLKESWSTNLNEATLGEPITRTITLTAWGTSGERLLPLPQKEITGLRQYPDQAKQFTDHEAHWLRGTRVEKTALIPTKTGTVTLPAVTLHWWNTQTQKPEVVTLPAHTLKIKAAATVEKPLAPEEASSPNKKTSKKDQWLLMLAISFFTAWLVTLLAWRNSRRDKNPPRLSYQAQKTLLSAIQKACENNDAEKTVATLMAWAEQQWPEAPPPNLIGIALRLSDQALQTEMEKLDQYHYGQEKIVWQNGNQLWDCLVAALRASTAKQMKDKDDPLPPLYPDSD